MKGNITISRNSRGVITISLIEEDSRVEFVEAELTTANFAEALTGLAHVECKLKVRGLDLVGLKREVKEELVPIPSSPTESEIKAAFAPFEVDGWSGYRNDATNSHRWSGKRGEDGLQPTRVHFTRHVSQDGREDAP